MWKYLWHICLESCVDNISSVVLILTFTAFTHVAGAGELPLRIAREKMLVFFESLPYTGLEIGEKFFFHLWPCKI